MIEQVWLNFKQRLDREKINVTEDAEIRDRAFKEGYRIVELTSNIMAPKEYKVGMPDAPMEDFFGLEMIEPDFAALLPQYAEWIACRYWLIKIEMTLKPITDFVVNENAIT